jgi:hypothetical protein
MAIMKCPYCGNKFDKPRGSKKKYCSKRCKDLTSYEKNRDPEKQNLKNKEYRELHPEYMRIWRKKNRIHNNAMALKYDQEAHKECKRLIGDKCIVCNSSDTICFHEKHGKPHIKSANWIRKHPKKFIPLCRSHHSTLHRLIEAKNSKLLEKLLELVKLSMDKENKHL